MIIIVFLLYHSVGTNGHNAYFAHSYHFDVVNNRNLLATTLYGTELRPQLLKII
ncbi:MAG: hypothetical protein ACTS6G_00620 [Candidatus Hodgkinia cicadicola]